MNGSGRRVSTTLGQSSDHHARHSPHVVVIGGGIAGLSTAYALQEQARLGGLSLACTLVEARGRLGGVILTERVGDFVIEAGKDLLPIEVKAGARPTLKDVIHLRSFRAEYGKTARAGLLLHTGSTLEWITPDVLAAPWWKVL